MNQTFVGLAQCLENNFLNRLAGNLRNRVRETICFWIGYNKRHRDLLLLKAVSLETLTCPLASNPHPAYN